MARPAKSTNLLGGATELHLQPHVSAGRSHTCWLKTDGALACWGNNDYGQTDVTSPNSGWVQVSAGWFHTCGLKEDGSLACWGVIEYGLPVLSVWPESLPAATTGTNYSMQLTAAGGREPYTFTLSSGVLPPGLSLSGGGLLQGIPSSPGSYPFRVLATDADQVLGERGYILVVKAGPATGLAAAPNPFFFGQTVVFTATVISIPSGVGTPGGALTFYDGETAIPDCADLTLNSSAQAVCSTAGMNVGSHNVKATFLGNVSFAPSTSSSLIQVVKRGVFLPVAMK